MEINNLILGVNIALGAQPVSACEAFADARGTPQPAAVEVWVDVDDFSRVYRAQTTADAAGRASVVGPAPHWPRVPAIAGYTPRRA